MYDAIIIGAGPAGLSAALILGRCRRKIVIFDAGSPRNAASHGLHGFLTRDGIHPSELLRIGREQLTPYGVEICDMEVIQACRKDSGFSVTLKDESQLSSRKLLIATGVSDRLPEIDGIEAFYGHSVFHCPYCDGWEMRDQPLAVYGHGRNGAGLALSLKTWTGDVVLCTDGRARIESALRERLARHQIEIRQQSIARLEGENGVLERILFKDGTWIARRGLFFSTGQDQRCDLPAKFGCVFTKKGAVRTNRLEGTDISGLYVAGDATHDVQLAIIAAAEGAKAGFAINCALQDEEHA